MSNRIVVVKFGTSILRSSKGTGLDKARLKDLIRQIDKLKKQGYKIILVSSGAIALGMQIMKLKRRPKKVEELQAAASVGQGMLIKLYNELFKSHGLLVAQVLLTYDDFNQRARYLNARNTINRLLLHGIVPVVNENDAVSTEEIKVGDNDKLSSLVANLVEANILIMLSDVDGLYDASGNLIQVVTNIDQNLCRIAGGTKHDTSVGGMSTKLEAACITCEAGIPCVVANGKTKDIILKVLDQKFVGTTFLPGAKRLVAKKRWLAFGSRPKGKIHIDEGAKNALLNGKSLLAVGVTGVDGKFEVGEVVSVAHKGREVARGITRCSAQELESAKGTRFKHEIIHRDNLVAIKKIGAK